MVHTAKSYTLMCYVSANNLVVVVFTIGDTTIALGAGQITDPFDVNIAVIDIT
jgi:hypothetical protein